MDNTNLEQNTCSCCQCNGQCNACEMNTPVLYVIEAPKYCCGNPQAEPVCYKPCWDACKCMEEIILIQGAIDCHQTQINTTNGRVTKVEGDLNDLDDRLSTQINNLTIKHNQDVACLDGKIDAEIARATNAEGVLDDKITAEKNRAEAAEGNLGNRIDAETARAILKEITDVDYVKADNKIYFKNSAGTVLDEISTSDFVKDGMVSSVEIKNDNLVITWNSDSGLVNPTSIPLSDIFNPNNYYTKSYVYNKTEVDNELTIIKNRLTALEALWQKDDSTNTLSPKSPYANVSMSGNATIGGTISVTSNATIGGTATITGNTSIGGNATITGSTTSNQFYDSDPNL